MNNLPAGFSLLSRTSPFIDLIGPIYEKKDASRLVISLFADDKHCNARGVVHGGVLGTLADIAMGYSAAFSTDPPTPLGHCQPDHRLRRQGAEGRLDRGTYRRAEGWARHRIRQLLLPCSLGTHRPSQHGVQRGGGLRAGLPRPLH